MSILSFDKPKKLMSTKEHNDTYVCDGGPEGAFVPNMSAADNNKYKAKHIRGADERVEIRKAFGGVQAVAVVYKNTVENDWRNDIYGHENVQISANGKMHLTFEEWEEFIGAIKEAKNILI